MDQRQKLLRLQELHLEMMSSYNEYIREFLSLMGQNLGEEKLGLGDFDMGQDKEKFEKIKKDQEKLKEDLALLRRILDNPFEVGEEEIYKTKDPIIWEK